jgi:hypothetical protein
MNLGIITNNIHAQQVDNLVVNIIIPNDKNITQINKILDKLEYLIILRREGLLSEKNFFIRRNMLLTKLN